MNSNRLRPCQISWLLFIASFFPGILRAANPPPPPPWQDELNADRTLQAALLLSPSKDSAEERARAGKLAGLYRRLAAKYPDAFPVQQAVGDALTQLENQQAAIPYLERAGALDPKNAEVAASLGSAYLQAGRVQAASAQYQRAVASNPDVASYHFALANVLYLFRRQLLSPPDLPDEQAVLRLALEHFRRAAELSPTDLPMAKAYAETFYIFAKPDWAQALTAWLAVRALSGENKDFANGHLARISLRLGRRADAAAYLADIHDPAFDALKVRLLQPAPPPAESPLVGP